MRIGYARCSTVGQDVEHQIDGLVALGVGRDHVYIDEGVSGRKANRPGLDEALRSLRSGDTLVVTKLDRLGRSVSDLSRIASDLEARGVRLEFDGTAYDPADPMGKLMFHMLSAFAEFEAGIIRQRTRDGVARAKAAGRYKGRPQKLAPAQQKLMWELRTERDLSVADLAELFDLSESGVYKYLARLRQQEAASGA